MLPYTLELAFAGTWQYIFHWGIGVALIIGLLAAAYFTTAIPLIGPFLGEFHKDLLWAAFAVAVFLAGSWMGDKDATIRCKAQQIVVEKTVKNAVNKATHPSKRQDRWDDPHN